MFYYSSVKNFTLWKLFFQFIVEIYIILCITYCANNRVLTKMQERILLNQIRTKVKSRKSPPVVQKRHHRKRSHFFLRRDPATQKNKNQIPIRKIPTARIKMIQRLSISLLAKSHFWSWNYVLLSVKWLVLIKYV